MKEADDEAESDEEQETSFWTRKWNMLQKMERGGGGDSKSLNFSETIAEDFTELEDDEIISLSISTPPSDDEE